MAFSLSPAVTVTEIDLTTVVPQVATTNTGLVGEFRWGPCKDITLVESEDVLVRKFGKPDTDNASTWFTAASFLSYGDTLRLVRMVASDAKNAAGDLATAPLILNDHEFELNLADGDYTTVDCMSSAKYPGVLGNSLKVSMCPSSKAFSMDIAGSTSSGTHLLAAMGVTFNTLAAGSYIVVKTSANASNVGVRRRVVSVDNDVCGAVLSSAFPLDIITGDTLTFEWEYKANFGVPPTTSPYASDKGGSNDQCHVVVVDEDGLFSGLAGQVVEKYAFLSKASDNKSEDGANNFFQALVNKKSNYARILNVPVDCVGTSTTAFATAVAPVTESLVGGVDGAAAITDGEIMQGYDLFSNAETVDISLLMLAAHSTAVAIYVVSNICESRKDCIALISPEMSDVVNNANPLDAVVLTREAINISSSLF